ncbi:MAG: PfkB family carbohydrate kinase [Fimbriimonadales bacterium]|nr:PfkB family carbohydrate kinase [Fimbriimonadales bacterium]
MTLGELLASMRGRSVLVVGDLMLDEYIVGRATRISPEAPVMVVRQSEVRRMPGGAANVARNVAALGGRATLVGVVGADEAGLQLRRCLHEAGLRELRLEQASDRPTTRKTRVLADHAHQVLRIDAEQDGPIPPETEKRLCEAVAEAAEDAEAVLVSDYRKGAVTAAVCAEALAAATQRGVPVVANPKPGSLGQYQGFTLVSLNRAEAAEALGMAEGLPDEAAPEAALELAGRIGGAALVTLGESGMVASWQGRAERFPAPKVEVYDTAGAGDTVIATVALALAASGLRREAFELAVRTSAAVVRRIGVAVPSAEDLRRIAEGSDAEV